jgi:CMP-2-keto-3-deoxyoctulosonic acid synthetase
MPYDIWWRNRQQGNTVEDRGKQPPWYGYRREFLLQLADLPLSRLEETESLEQLRVLESGHCIVVGVVDEPTIGIDTAEDYRAFVERCRQSTLPR